LWKNGSVYDGDFKNGLKHGKGVWTKGRGENLTTYTGEYLLDKKCGYGVFKWASGNIYKGYYDKDEREGHGEMVWTDGSKYLGSWVRGIQHGFGKMVFPDGIIREGQFVNNIFKGELENEFIKKVLSPIPEKK